MERWVQCTRLSPADNREQKVFINMHHCVEIEEGSEGDPATKLYFDTDVSQLQTRGRAAVRVKEGPMHFFTWDNTTMMSVDTGDAVMSVVNEPKTGGVRAPQQDEQQFGLSDVSIHSGDDSEKLYVAKPQEPAADEAAAAVDGTETKS